MTHSPLVWIGLGGVASDDNESAHYWQRRLHWTMVSVALVSVPAYVLTAADVGPAWQRTAVALDFIIFAAFAAELVWMMWKSSFPFRYLFENWLNVIIVIGAAAAALGTATEWIAAMRVMRAAVAVLILVRAGSEFHMLFTKRGAPMLFGMSLLTMLGLGTLFFWLDPAIKSFWDGLWLAFITGATVGYGDVVPTTAATRVIAVLTVLIGVAMMTVFTGSVVASFIGGEEIQTRENLQRDIVALRGEIASLLDAEELRLTHELHNEIRELRRELAELRAEIRPLKPPAAGNSA
jgi:voltage-gated potassium channel